ncbi:hypothetical protein [Chakrabartyella piscis]|uniref:YobI family P-loop NTPase n=1 Tax=Chakrabartyella piscis TaxID=2918914 RepID=UPI002958DE9E|nr:hypothetical protein [Chakrabartyella piscis]
MNDNKYNFQKLTPKQDADIAVYDEAIGFTFENDDVKNVAISGAYSSGKSSLIESYKTKHPEKQFIHLSLAHFRSSKQEDDTSEDDGKVKESVLEGKILNQLIHQISAEKIPQTNFRVKKEVDKTSIVLITTVISVFVSCVCFLMFHGNIIQYTSVLPSGWMKSLLDVLITPYSVIIAVLLLIVCGIVFVFTVVKTQKNKNIFHKISLQGNEIEIFEKQDESYFDKYLNEVLYLFENVDADVIVFEDMDRFNASKIFERLREVNTLVNIHRKKQQKEKYKPLRFFYLIRDDIFISKDRTKFFDYIVPVVPIVDSSNSHEQFIKHLKKSGLLEKFNQSFLQGLSLYIDDMRILKNIYNEFVVYFNRLNITDLNCDKMLAMIAYKNIFPRDFSNLQLKQGFVNEIFAQKSNFVTTEIELLQNKINAVNNQIDLVTKESLINEEEIDIIYDHKISSLPTDYYGRPRNSKDVDTYNEEREKRKQVLKDKLGNAIVNFEKEMVTFELEINKVESKLMKDIISRENIEVIFSAKFENEIGAVNEFTEIRGSEYFDLLKYLIRNGFIDETYSDYMTYFYEDSISANDKTFLRRITDKRGAEYTYKLKEPMKVISSPLLRQVDFEEEEVLNFDLVQCILDNSSDNKYDNYLKTLISQLNENGKFDFASQYYSKDISHETFVIKINEYWNSFFYTVLKNDKLPKEQIRKYSIETLYYSDDKTVKLVDIDECLKDYISYSDDYLQIKEPNIPSLIARFKLLDILFVTFNYDVSNKDLFGQVYQENLYVINFSNLKLMLQKEYSIDNEDDIIHKNYTLVQSDPNSPLAKYIANNLYQYIEVVLLSCAGEIYDDLNEVIYLLNCDEIEQQQKEEYIDVLSTTLNDISAITDTSLWKPLLLKELIKFDEDNVLEYYRQFGLVRELIDYINISVKPLDFTNAKGGFGEEICNKFFGSVFANNEIDTDKYQTILLGLGYYYNTFTTENIENAKMTVLIAEQIIRMTSDNLLHLREHYAGHVSVFIERSLDKYLELQNTELFVLTEALQVIKLDFEVDRKIKLISLTSEPISIINNAYEDEVCVHILTHNLDSEDLDSLYQNYSKYQERTKEKVFNLAIEYISNLIDSKAEIDDLLLSLLFETGKIDFGYKTNLLDNILPKLNEESCCAIFDKVGVTELKNIFTKGSGRRKYNITDQNIEILDVLKKHGWIYTYNVDEHNESKCYIVKNKPKSKVEFLD